MLPCSVLLWYEACVAMAVVYLDKHEPFSRENGLFSSYVDVLPVPLKRHDLTLLAVADAVLGTALSSRVSSSITSSMATVYGGGGGAAWCLFLVGPQWREQAMTFSA